MTDRLAPGSRFVVPEGLNGEGLRGTVLGDYYNVGYVVRIDGNDIDTVLSNEQTALDPPLTCPRCKRPVNPWPIGNRSICAPKDWVKCIRNDLERPEEAT